MVKQDQVRVALRKVGMYNRYWGRAEMRELSQTLIPGEKIVGAVNGRYEGGFAMLVATDRRLLLVDRKMMFLNIEDIRYDMIAQVEYCARLIDASTVIHTINNVLRFTSIRQNMLRTLTSFIQERIMEIRNMIEQRGEELPPSAMRNIAGEQSSTQYQTALYPNHNHTETTEPTQSESQIVAQKTIQNTYVNSPLSVRRRHLFYTLPGQRDR